jgi:hypothetical protein
MKHHKMTADEAIMLVRSQRPIAGPNPFFIEQLHDYEAQLLLTDKSASSTTTTTTTTTDTPPQ